MKYVKKPIPVEVDGELYPVRKSIFEKTYEEYNGQE